MEPDPILSEAERRRPVLASLAVAGVLAGTLGLAGVFAESTDRAQTGENRWQSGALEELQDVDIQLALLDGSCGTFTEDLETGLFAVTEDESDDLVLAGFCLRNNGNFPVRVAAVALDVVDVEVACTNREAEVDETCGSGGLGELSGDLGISAYLSECDVDNGFPAFDHRAFSRSLADLATARVELVQLPPDSTTPVCLMANTGYSFSERASQSDRVTWRFAFEASEVGCTAVDPEPNDELADAIPLQGDDVLQGTLCEDDVDLYAIDHGGEGLWATVEFDATATDIDLELLDASGTPVATAEGTTGTEVVGAEDLPPGTYYVRVFEFRGRATGIYEIHLGAPL